MTTRYILVINHNTRSQGRRARHTSASVHARATHRVATRGDAPIRGWSGGRVIRTHSISVSWKRKPAWRSRRRASTHADAHTHADVRTHARTHTRTFARDLVPFIDVALNSTYASAAEFDIFLRDRVTSSRRVPHRAASCRVVFAIFYFHARQQRDIICRMIAVAATAASPASRLAPLCATRCISSTRVCTSYLASIRNTVRGCFFSSSLPSPACCWSPLCSQGATTLHRKSLDR